MTQQVERARSVVTDGMVDRFLTWPVPADVYPDGESGKPGRTGTNLLTATQAQQMLEYVLSDTEGAPPPVDRTVVLSGAQLLDALDFIAPDRFSDPEQLESDALITRGDGHSGTGYYCALADCPEEGSILLDGTFGEVRPGANDSCDTHDQGAESIKDGAPRHPDILDNNSVQVGFEAPGKFDFAAHLNRQRDFSLRSFGPGSRVAGVVDHIRKELREVEESNGDLAEWTDVIILALDGALRSGATPDEIIDALVAKQVKNEGRKWPDWRTADLDKAIEHDRSQDVALVVAQPVASAVSAMPENWRERFVDEVYDNLAAADNQDIPLEDYPARILAVLDSIAVPSISPVAAQPSTQDRVDAERYRGLRSTLHNAKAGGGIEVNAQLQFYETPVAGEEVRIYWYQDTPVGFYQVVGSTLDATADAVLERTRQP